MVGVGGIRQHAGCYGSPCPSCFESGGGVSSALNDTTKG